MEIKSHIDVLGGLSPLYYYDTFRKEGGILLHTSQGSGWPVLKSTMYVTEGGTQLRTG